MVIISGLIGLTVGLAVGMVIGVRILGRSLGEALSKKRDVPSSTETVRDLIRSAGVTLPIDRV